MTRYASVHNHGASPLRLAREDGPNLRSHHLENAISAQRSTEKGPIIARFAPWLLPPVN